MEVEPKTETFYYEVQQFRQWWVWLITVIAVIMAWWTFIRQIVVGHPMGSGSGPDTLVWILFLIVGVGLPWFVLSIRMITEVKSERVKIRLFPFVFRTIYLKDIQNCAVREYHPLMEQDGKSIRWFPSKSVAYVLAGKTGVEIELAGGKKVLIGSQRAEELATGLKKALNR